MTCNLAHRNINYNIFYSSLYGTYTFHFYILYILNHTITINMYFLVSSSFFSSDAGVWIQNLTDAGQASPTELHLGSLESCFGWGPVR